jgi:hypothetical protein
MPTGVAPTDLPRGAAHLHAFQVGHAADRFVGRVKHARAVHVQRQHLGFLELVRALGLEVFPIGLGRGLGVVHHERQLKHLDAREAPGGVGRQCPHDVDHTITRLVVQLHRRAAQLHGRVALELDAPTAFFFNLVHPRLVHGEPDVAHRRHEGVELQRDALLRQARKVGCAQHRCGGGALNKSAAFHG